MRFQTPQFIEIEDKIFGPLTAKQFVYLAGGAGIIAVSYFFLPLFVALPIIAGAAAHSGALAFYKLNNQPFITVLESFLKYILGARLYLWKKRPKSVEHQERIRKTADSFIPTVGESKLANMSWNLTVEDQKNTESNEKEFKIEI